MKNKILIFILLTSIAFLACKKDKDITDIINYSNVNIIDHNCTKLSAIPQSYIEEAKNTLHIAYAHTSHGTQLITGMTGLIDFKGDLYNWNESGTDGALHIDDTFAYGDLGNPDFTSWAQSTREYLPTHTDINVVIWGWCGQVSTASEENINTYLSLMTALEVDYPNIKFIYMTGHLDGSGLEGNLHIRNQQIRKYCSDYNKTLYDFEDIESYDPSGNYFGDKLVNDGCEYDSDGNGSLDANWATEWQNSHTEDVDWYNCTSAHSEALNANMKAYAAWHLWARLAGWSGN